MYTTEQLEKCKEWLIKHDFYDALCELKIPDSWHKEQKVECIDRLILCKRSYIGDEQKYKGCNEEHYTYNINEIVSAKSRHELACLWYQKGEEKSHRGDSLSQTMDFEEPVPIGTVNRENLKYDTKRDMFYQTFLQQNPTKNNPPILVLSFHMYMYYTYNLLSSLSRFRR